MTEAFLQYVWQHRLLEGPLATTEGVPVTVLRAGELNRDAGPDFFDARITIGGLQWVGNVEVHVRASDWTAHGHSGDKAYNNVILHVVYVHDADISTEDGKVVPTLVIADAIPESVLQNYEQLMHAGIDQHIACAARLGEIPDFYFQLNQERLIVERLERKSDDVSRLLTEARGGWEQVCYWLVARYFGGKTNALPFELVAKHTPLQVVAKMKDSPERVEALLFGQAGLLDGTFEDDYPRAMQREYAYQRKTYDLQPVDAHLWKFFRLRPSGFPTLRISQFAQLLVKSANLFSTMLDTREVGALRALFEVQASPYWLTHYTFDHASPRRTKSLGSGVVDSIIINAWVPLLFQYGVTHGDEGRKEQAFSLLDQLPPEDNRIVRLWAQAGIQATNAAQTQALIQRYNAYCTAQRCLDCQLAYRLIKGKNR